MSVIILDATTDSLEAILAGAKSLTDPDFMTSYADNDGSTFTEKQNDGTLNGITAVSIVAAPGASTRRIVKGIIIYNADNADITVTIRLNANGTYRNLFKETVVVGATFEWPISGGSSASEVSDTAYAASWDGVTTIAPSKNAVYDGLMAKTGANLAIGSDADGDTWYRASGLLARLAAGTANFKKFMNAAGTAPEWARGIGIIGATRDYAAASGDVSYTGFGFKPSALIIIAADNATAAMSFGFAVATAGYGILQLYTGVCYAGGVVDMQNAASVGQGAAWKSYDADGFTLTWTKTGSPTGTIALKIIAFR
jgi:hypothetical protein